MKSKKLVLILIAIAVVVSYAVLFSMGGGDSASKVGATNLLSLASPAFASSASAAGAAFPKDEAGISAYVNLDRTIDIEMIKEAFSEVKEVGDNYIIGIVPVPNFGGDIDVHVYADTDGWMVAYLERGEVAAKIIQWLPADPDNPVVALTTTTLRDALFKAAKAAGVSIRPGDTKYYHFGFPDADGMTIFVKTQATVGSSIVNLKIPTAWTLYEASFYHYVRAIDWRHSSSSELKVDGVMLNTLTVADAWQRTFDKYAGRVTIGILHTIEITLTRDDSGSAGVGTVLIYNAD